MVIFGLRIEICHDIGQSWMFDTHMLSHRAFSAIWLLAVGDWTHIFSLYFVSTSPGPFFSLFCRRIIQFFVLSYEEGEFLNFLVDVWKLGIEYLIGELQFSCLFDVEIESLFKVIVEYTLSDGLVFVELLVVPPRITVKSVLLPFEQTPLHLFSMLMIQRHTDPPSY